MITSLLITALVLSALNFTLLVININRMNYIHQDQQRQILVNDSQIKGLKHILFKNKTVSEIRAQREKDERLRVAMEAKNQIRKA